MAPNVLYNRLAEVAKYLKKGQSVYVEGRLQTRKWRDQNGQDRYTTEIVGDNMQMLGSRAGASSEASSSITRMSQGLLVKQIRQRPAVVQ